MSCIIFLYCCRISARKSWSHLRSHTHQESGGNWISHQWEYLISTCEFVSCILHSYCCRFTVRKSLRRNPCYGIVLIETSEKHLRSQGSGGNWIIKRWNYLISPREFLSYIQHEADVQHEHQQEQHAMLFLLMFGGWPVLIKGSLGACVVWRVHEHQQEQHAMLFLLMFNMNISRNNMPCCSCWCLEGGPC